MTTERAWFSTPGPPAVMTHFGPMRINPSADQSRRWIAAYRKCLAQPVGPPGRIVYEEDPRNAAFLAQSGEYSSDPLEDYGICLVQPIAPASWPRTTFATDVEIERPPSEDVLTWSKGRTWDTGKVRLIMGDYLRLYAGQLDPRDPSHFTVDYELPIGRRNTIDFYLRDNDVLAMIPRSGVMKKSVQWPWRLVWQVAH